MSMKFLSRADKTPDVYTGHHGDLEDMGGTQIRPGSPQMMGKEGDGIQVVTVVQQDSTPLAREETGPSDSESTRKLVKEYA